MCRSIKRLREGTEIVGEDEVREAARQFVRKISGFGKPSAHNEDVFNKAVDEITRSSIELMESLVIGKPATASS